MTIAAEMTRALLETTLAGSGAMLLVLLLAPLLRRYCGSQIAYRLWAVVPVAMLAVLLPAPVRQVLFDGLTVATGGAPVASIAVETDALRTESAWPLLMVWLLGLLACLAALRLQQSRFVRGLGRVQRRCDGLWQAESVAGLPAVLGLAPRIVLPADFETQYTQDERVLIVEHERLHVRRGDLLANAAAAAMQCLFWFNPLLPFAIRRFRRDQELACDEAIVTRHPTSRLAYGKAMLKAGGVFVPPAPLACQWFGGHPLKERIAMLNAPLPTRRRWISGSLAVLLLASITGVAAWAAQPTEVEPVSDASQTEAAEIPEVKGKTMDANFNDMEVGEIAKQVASKNGLRFDGEIPDPTRKLTMNFVKVSVTSVLQIIGEETKSTPVVENGVLRFVSAPPKATQKQQGAGIETYIKLEGGGRLLALSFAGQNGGRFHATEGDSSGLAIEGTSTLRPDGHIDVATNVYLDGKKLASPELAVPPGIASRMQISASGHAPAIRMEVRAAPRSTHVAVAAQAPRG